MSDPTLPRARSSPSAIRLIFAIILLLIAAAAIYFALVRQQGPKHLKLALVTWTEDPFWEPLIRGAQDCANRTDAELTIVRCKPTVDDQNQQLRKLIDGGIDGLAVSPNNADAEKAILDEATAKFPVVTFDTDAPNSQRRRFVGIDNYAAGRLCADELKDALPDGGAVLITVGSVQQQHGRDRRQGVIDGLLDHPFDRAHAADPVDAELKGGKYSIVATVTDDADVTNAPAKIAAALKAHPEVKGIVGLFSYSAPAALEAIKQVGRDGQIKVVGFDESEPTQAGIESGKIAASILQDSYRAGYESIEVLANEARGTPRGPAEWTPTLAVPINVLTNKNIADLRQAGSLRPTATSPTQPATMP